MGNLIYFFEFINEHHELEGVFDEDIEDLFEFRGSHVERKKHDDPKYLAFFSLVNFLILHYSHTIVF